MTQPRTLLINPTITSRTSARFPLALLHLAAALDRTGSSRIIDGNVDRDFVNDTLHAMQRDRFDAVGIGVMGGPQVAPAIAVSQAIRARFSGGADHLGRLLPDPVPGSDAERALRRLRGPRRRARKPCRSWSPRSAATPARALEQIAGLSLEARRQVVHNPERAARAPTTPRGCCPTTSSAIRAATWRAPTSAQRTVAHQAALGCRYRCTFCGVAAMFGGATVLPAAARLERELGYLQARAGRRRGAVLRPQLLRPRGGHGAAARSDGPVANCRGGASPARMRC